MKKIIFLDIDGVLCFTGGEISPIHVRRLKKIIDETGARIILSSAWRLDEGDRLEVQRVLLDCGILWDIKECTPLGNWSMNRPEEIRQWLENNPDEWDQWVALDDDIRCQKLGSHWIQCFPPPIKPHHRGSTLMAVGDEDHKYGLSDEVMEQTIAFFVGEEQDGA